MVWIGSVQITGPLAMSPMAGISDSPTRRLARSMGSAFSYSEFVSTDHLIVNSPKSWKMLNFSELERPLYFQIFGSKVSTVLTAAKMILHLKPDVIDLNMGCSVSKVSHRGSGAGLLRALPIAGKMIEGLRNLSSIPITAKIRLGWDESSRNYKETVHVLQESGVQGISVHGRTKSMGYTGIADWNAISEIKSYARVPIFGNGDVSSYQEGLLRKKESNVDLVLIGRKSIGNPWIFADEKEISKKEWFDTVRLHLDSMVDFYGSESFGLQLFRKHFVRYLQKWSHFDPLLRSILLQTLSLPHFYHQLTEGLDQIPEEQKREVAEIREVTGANPNRTHTCSSFI